MTAWPPFISHGQIWSCRTGPQNGGRYGRLRAVRNDAVQRGTYLSLNLHLWTPPPCSKPSSSRVFTGIAAQMCLCKGNRPQGATDPTTANVGVLTNKDTQGASMQRLLIAERQHYALRLGSDTHHMLACKVIFPAKGCGTESLCSRSQPRPFAPSRPPLADPLEASISRGSLTRSFFTPNHAWAVRVQHGRLRTASATGMP